VSGVSPFVLAALTGFVSGLLLSIPVGPINFTIINEGARRGFRWSLLIGLGASAMEVIYCTIAFTSFASFFSRGYVKAVMEVTSFVFLLYLGLKFLAAKSVTAVPRLTSHGGRFEERIEARIETRFEPRSVFMTGFVRVLANPGVLIFWIILSANFVSREWVDAMVPGARWACIAGVAAGTSLWFVVLSWVVSIGHKKLEERTLRLMERLSGAILVGLALAHGADIAWQIIRHGR
jgi:threonine/homoserine/homoserine lactone efflux protein